MKSENSYRTTITWGFIIRVVLILFLSTYQNIYQQDTTLTDIDYKVYSDAALYSSPYDRHTFRYSPIIAYINQWNYSVHESIGKLILAFIDTIAMYFLWKIVSRGITSSMTKKTAENNANLILKLYSYNPLFIYLTVRGSIQSITLALMYAFWYYFFTGEINGNQSCFQIITNKISTQQPKRWISYIIFGLWVHLRVYPIILVPLIVCYQYESNNKNFKIALRKFIQMGLLSGGVFIALGGLFYSIYGYSFIQQTYIYHFSRLDNRHSFSAYFYQIYLNYNNQIGTASRSLIRVIPSIYIILTVSTKYLRGYSPIYLHFLMTYAFVSFNKVITFQYYMWILGALLLVLPQSIIFSSKRYRMGFGLLLQYIFPISIWIWLSMRLEGNGENYLHTMWLICLFQIFFQLWVLISFMKSIKCYNPIEEKKQKLQLSKKILSGKQD